MKAHQLGYFPMMTFLFLFIISFQGLTYGSMFNAKTSRPADTTLCIVGPNPLHIKDKNENIKSLEAYVELFGEYCTLLTSRKFRQERIIYYLNKSMKEVWSIWKGSKSEHEGYWQQYNLGLWLNEKFEEYRKLLVNYLIERGDCGLIRDLSRTEDTLKRIETWQEKVKYDSSIEDILKHVEEWQKEVEHDFQHIKDTLERVENWKNVTKVMMTVKGEFTLEDIMEKLAEAKDLESEVLNELGEDEKLGQIDDSDAIEHRLSHLISIHMKSVNAYIPTDSEGQAIQTLENVEKEVENRIQRGDPPERIKWLKRFLYIAVKALDNRMKLRHDFKSATWLITVDALILRSTLMANILGIPEVQLDDIGRKLFVSLSPAYMSDRNMDVLFDGFIHFHLHPRISNLSVELPEMATKLDERIFGSLETKRYYK